MRHLCYKPDMIEKIVYYVTKAKRVLEGLPIQQTNFAWQSNYDILSSMLCHMLTSF
jgi:hypothetical protein